MTEKKTFIIITKVISVIITIICGMTLGSGVVLLAHKLYFSGFREIGKAPAGYVWQSSGGAYGHVSGAIFWLLVIILGFTAMVFLQVVVMPNLPNLPKNEEYRNHLGCLPLIIGVILGVAFIIAEGALEHPLF